MYRDTDFPSPQSECFLSMRPRPVASSAQESGHQCCQLFFLVRILVLLEVQLCWSVCTVGFSVTNCHMPLAFVMALTTIPSSRDLEQGEDLANVCEKCRQTTLPAPRGDYYEDIECDRYSRPGSSSSDEKSPKKVVRTWKKVKALAFWGTRRGSQTSASSSGSRESGKGGPKSAPSSTAGPDNACCDEQTCGVQEHACLSGSIPTGRWFSNDGLRPSIHGERQHIFLTDTHCDPVTGSNLHDQRRFSVSCGSLPNRQNHSGCRASLRAHPGRQDVSAASHPHVGGRSVLLSHPRRSCDNVSTVHESPGTHGFSVSSRNRRHTSKDSNCFSSSSPVNARQSQTRFSVSCSSLHDHQHNHSHRHNSSRSSTSIHQGNQNVHVSSHSKERSKLFEAVKLPPAHLRRASLSPAPLHSPLVDRCIKVTSSSHIINPQISSPGDLSDLSQGSEHEEMYDMFQLQCSNSASNRRNRVMSFPRTEFRINKHSDRLSDPTYVAFVPDKGEVQRRKTSLLVDRSQSLGMVPNPLYYCSPPVRTMTSASSACLAAC